MIAPSPAVSQARNPARQARPGSTLATADAGVTGRYYTRSRPGKSSPLSHDQKATRGGAELRAYEQDDPRTLCAAVGVRRNDSLDVSLIESSVSDQVGPAAPAATHCCSAAVTMTKPFRSNTRKTVAVGDGRGEPPRGHAGMTGCRRMVRSFSGAVLRASLR